MVHISLNHFTLPFFCNKVIKVKRIELIQFTIGVPIMDSNKESLFFAKACFWHPSPSKQQKLNATANAFGAPDVLRTCHFATTIVNSVLAS